MTLYSHIARYKLLTHIFCLNTIDISLLYVMLAGALAATPVARAGVKI